MERETLQNWAGYWLHAFRYIRSKMPWSSLFRRTWLLSPEQLSRERFFLRSRYVPSQVQQTLTSAAVTVETFGEIDISPLCQILRSLGIAVNREPASLVLAVTDTYLTSSRLDETIRQRLGEGTPCLILQPSGLRPLVGPLLRPRNLCWECFKQAIRRHDPVPLALQKLQGGVEKVEVPVAYLPSTLRQVYAFSAQAVLQFILQGTSALLEEHLVSFDSATLIQKQHAIIPWVFCSTCLEKESNRFPVTPDIRLDWQIDDIESMTTINILEESLETLDQITDLYTGVLATRHIKQDPEVDGLYYWAIVTHPFYNNEVPGHNES